MHWFFVIGTYLLCSLICWLRDDKTERAIRRSIQHRRSVYMAQDDELSSLVEYELEHTYYDSAGAREGLRDHRS